MAPCQAVSFLMRILGLEEAGSLFLCSSSWEGEAECPPESLRLSVDVPGQ